jgi:glycerophosphoryl diester phosphodiesterase
VTVHRLPDHESQLVIASDGYPRILPTLKACEESLACLLARDPMCVGPLRGTKGITPGHSSYDDRAYLRLQV